VNARFRAASTTSARYRTDSPVLARYTIVRGAPAATLPVGLRYDTRKHTRHFLRPSKEIVAAVFASSNDDYAWATYAASYRALLDERFAAARAPFDRLATYSRWHDVYLGCSCPSSKNPDVYRCHTVLALAFMKEHYPDLAVRFPDGLSISAR
jgi:hypothetical protein